MSPSLPRLIGPVNSDLNPLNILAEQTIDLAGGIKFGPDVEDIAKRGSIDDAKPGCVVPEDDQAQEEEWWNQHLQPSLNRKEEMVEAIHDYASRIASILGLSSPPSY